MKAVEKNRLPYNQLHDFHSSPNIWVIKSKRIGLIGHVARMEDRRCEYNVLMGRPEEKRPLGRPWCRWRIMLKCTFK